MTEQVKRAIATGETLKDKYPVGVQWELSNIKALQHKNVADLLTEGLRRNASGIAISFMGNKISYSELNDLVNQAAKGLQEMGVEKGTKVGLHMPNTPYYQIMFMAALRIGATVVNFSPLYNEDELATQIKDSDTEVMVTLNLNDFIDKSVSLKEQGVLKSIVKCDLQDMLPSIKKTAFNLLKSSEVRSDTEHSVNFNDIIQNDGNVETAKVSPDDIAVLQYTSGSTGVPKGAMLTHFNLAANTTQVCGFFGENNMKPPGATNIGYASEKILATIPYFHVYGMMTAMINPLQMGNEIIIIPNPRDIPGTLATIDKEKPSITPLVPTLIRAFDEHPKTAWQAFKADKKNGFLKRVFNAVTKYPLFRSFDLTSIKGVVSGGAALPPATAESFEKMVGTKGVIKQGYGLSETSPVASSNPGYGRNDPSTVGLPYPGTEIKIADPNDPDKIMAIGEMGEICIRGPQVFKGYYNKPNETAEVLTEDGWFRTGDLGHLDDDMYLHITDRKKRMIIVNGENVFPNKIESKICKHPAIAECVVIGLPDKRSGEAAKVFIRYKNDAPRPSKVELQQFLQKELTKAEMPKYLEISEEEFPNKNGKTDWKALQDAERAKLLDEAKSTQPDTQEFKPA